MLTKEQNETLTRVGPGTPMGEMMRRYWIPALLDYEVAEPDGEPAILNLLGEELVAFRQTDGQIGVVGARCAHRRAHLFFGRNEDCGLRCVYHGWKYDINGQCIDMPNEPVESNFKDKVRIPAYPAYETGGVVWVYMGPPEKQPPPPLFEWTQVEEPYRSVTKVIQESNWLQGLEGGIDSSHTNFLHGIPPHKQYSAEDPSVMNRARRISMAPVIQVVPTDYGYTYAGIRTLGDEGNYVRAYHWIAPWTQLRPGSMDGQPTVHGHFWVPMDDYNTMVWNFTYTFGEKPLNEHEKKQAGLGNVLGEDVDAKTFRSFANARNNYLIDREVQKNETYTGITGTNTQDRAIQETMGPIADRTLERLGTADRAIITARRQLLAAVKAMQEEGADPPGADDSYYRLRSIQDVLPKDSHWLNELKARLFQLEEAAAGAD
jgi:phenylpropionate dioxygenase-like ring-hydroxylating dioxygenase large terminal subunit